MVSKYCRCGHDNSAGKKLCPHCSRDLTVAVMPDLCHIQNWPHIIRQSKELFSLVNDHQEGARQFTAVLFLLEDVIGQASIALASAERGVVPCTEV